MPSETRPQDHRGRGANGIWEEAKEATKCRYEHLFFWTQHTHRRKDNLIICEGHNCLLEEVQDEQAIIDFPRQKLLTILNVIFVFIFMSLGTDVTAVLGPGIIL